MGQILDYENLTAESYKHGKLAMLKKEEQSYIETHRNLETAKLKWNNQNMDSIKKPELQLQNIQSISMKNQ